MRVKIKENLPLPPPENMKMKTLINQLGEKDTKIEEWVRSVLQLFH